jgi:hypothetical protein
MGRGVKRVWIEEQYDTTDAASWRCKFVHPNKQQCMQTFSAKSESRHKDHLHTHSTLSKHMIKAFGDHPEKLSTKSIIQSMSVTSTKQSTTLDQFINNGDSTQSTSPVINLTSSSTSTKPNALAQGFAHQANAMLDNATAKAWANCSLPYSLIDNKYFAEFLKCVRASSCTMPTRKCIPIAQATCAAELKKQVLAVIRTMSKMLPVSIATDGWTDTCGQKVTNVLVLVGGYAFYWRSIYAPSGTAVCMAPLISAVIEELMDNGISIIAFVADNESVNGATYRLIAADYPWIIHVGCASHVIQLIVKKALESPSLARSREQARSLIRAFQRSKKLRRKLVDFQTTLMPTTNAVKVVKIVDTRWNSELAAMIRLVRLEPALTQLLLVHSDDFNRLGFDTADPDQLWNGLKAAIRFLTPMQKATDITQSDSASLYDIFLQFSKLKTHANNQLLEPANRTSALALQSAIDQHWDAHVNQDAVIASALLSFHSVESIEDEFDSTARASARQWFKKFCGDYLLRDEVRRCVPEGSWRVSRSDLEARCLALFDQFMVPQEPLWVELWTTVAGKKEDLLKAEQARLESVNGSVGDQPILLHFDARSIWSSVYVEHPTFVQCVCALLSVHASEAAVERAFSAQGKTHTAVRNSLKPSSIENEMFIKFNMRSFQNGVLAKLDRHRMFGAVIELEDEEPEMSDLDAQADMRARLADTQSMNHSASSSVQPADPEAPSSMPQYRHYQWVVNEGISRRQLVIEWLATEGGQRSVMPSGRIRINDTVENDLIAFATTRGSNDMLSDLISELRVHVAELRVSQSLHVQPDQIMSDC